MKYKLQIEFESLEELALFFEQKAVIAAVPQPKYPLGLSGETPLLEALYKIRKSKSISYIRYAGLAPKYRDKTLAQFAEILLNNPEELLECKEIGEATIRKLQKAILGV